MAESTTPAAAKTEEKAPATPKKEKRQSMINRLLSFLKEKR